MSLKSQPQRYGAVPILIHWATALAIVLMLASGLAASNSTDPSTEANILRVHAILGVTVGALTLFRIVWWWFIDRRPADHPDLTPWQKRASHLVHYGLYVAILVMVASGMATLVLTGANLQVFGAAPLPLPSFDGVAPFTTHSILWRVLLVLVLGHVGAALYHQVIRRDRLLARMGVGR